MQHDGETDTLGPLNFSANARGMRADNMGDGDKGDDSDEGNNVKISIRARVKWK